MMACVGTPCETDITEMPTLRWFHAALGQAVLSWWQWGQNMAKAGLWSLGVIPGCDPLGVPITLRPTARPGWHPLALEVLWVCRCWQVALMALHQAPSGTAGSVLGTEWHSWICAKQHSWPWAGHQAAQLVLHWTLCGTAGSTSAPSRPGPRYQVPWTAPRAALWPQLLLAHAEGWLLGTSEFSVLTSCFDSSLLLVLALSNSISAELQPPAPMASTKKSVGLLLFKKKSSIQLFCQEHILPAEMCHLVRPKNVLWQTPGVLLGTVSKAFAHACSLYSCWII